MGRDKALLPVAGVPMARRVADALAAAGASDVVAAGGDAAGLVRAGLTARTDSAPGEGPLPAVVDALDGTGPDLVLVVGCDLVAPDPHAMAAVVAALAAAPAADVAVPVVDEVRQWHHGAWRRAARGRLVAALADGAGSLRRAAAALTVVEVAGLPPAALADADRPEDLPAEAAAPCSGPSRGADSLPAMDVPEIDVVELAARRAEGAPLIDVREDDEFAEAHVPGAVPIPLGQVPDRLGEVPTEGTVYVICARGGRSAKAVEHYRAAGIDAVNVAGGTLAWIDAGYATDAGSGGA